MDRYAGLPGWAGLVTENLYFTPPGSQFPVLEEESKDLAAEVLPPGLLVVHDAAGGGEHHLAELPGGQQVVGPLLDVPQGDVEPGQGTW